MTAGTANRWKQQGRKLGTTAPSSDLMVLHLHQNNRSRGTGEPTMEMPSGAESRRGVEKHKENIQT